MSDCSSNAMKPKAPPKTCGNCEIIASNTHKNTVCAARVIGACDNWKSRIGTSMQHYQELEQRYQQLEHVAKDMFCFMNLIFDDIGIEPTFTSAVTRKVMSLPRFREQLEALGVSLDD